MTSPGTPFHIDSSTCRLLCASVLVLLLASTLSGCAVYAHATRNAASRAAQGTRRSPRKSSHRSISVRTWSPPRSRCRRWITRVYLYGVVSSGLEISDAESIACSVPGVRQVINSMAISQSR